MPIDVKKQGQYKLLKTDHGHRILDLKNKAYYAWIEGQQGEILVHSDEDHQFTDTLQEGEFRYVEFQNDPEYKDMPHLFLEKGGRYEEVMLPNGLPSDNDPQKKVVRTDNTLGKGKLEDYLKNPKSAGPGENRLERSQGTGNSDLPIQDYAAKTVDEITGQLGDLNEDELQQIERHEKQNKNRKTLKQAIEGEFRKRDQ